MKQKKKNIYLQKLKNLSPSVRKIVEEKNIDISNIEGTGKAGRISKGDLINLMGNIPNHQKEKLQLMVTRRTCENDKIKNDNSQKIKRSSR